MISDILLKTILLLLPTQLGKHFWPSFARVSGLRVDYLSPTVYFIDLIIVLYTISVLSNIGLKKLTRYYLYPLTAILIFSVFNIVFAYSPLNTLLFWIRLFGYILFFISLRFHRLSLSALLPYLLTSSIMVIVVQFIQTTLQSSIGGYLYYLGERSFSSSTSGLAKVNLFGLDFVRAPSIFSHPNSLAGYLLVVYLLLVQSNRKLYHYRLLILLGLCLTLSKTALITFLLVFILHINNLSLIFAGLILTLSQSLFCSASSIQINSISTRLKLIKPTLQIIRNNFLTGTGLGGFLPSLPRYISASQLTYEHLQPVHNLFLLVLSELGVIGYILIIYLARKAKYILTSPVFTLFVIIVLTGSLDHYWWTLSQNKLILIIALAFLL